MVNEKSAATSHGSEEQPVQPEVQHGKQGTKQPEVQHSGPIGVVPVYAGGSEVPEGAQAPAGEPEEPEQGADTPQGAESPPQAPADTEEG
jgi:hypothetical protein